MAAPKTAPAGLRATKFYRSPDVVPETWWSSDRPGIVEGLQPRGTRLGNPGPDQGFAIKVANILAADIHLAEGEQVDDAVRGCVLIALRRASLYSRAPTVHDVRLAYTIWGYFLPDPPADLVARRTELFAQVSNVLHHYAAGRKIVDLVPDETLRMTPDQAAAMMPARWAELTGA